MSTDITPDDPGQPRDEAGRFAPPTPAPEPTPEPTTIDPERALLDALKSRDHQDYAVEHLLRSTGYLSDDGLTEKAKRWMRNQAEPEPSDPYAEPGYYEQPDGQYVTVEQLQQILAQQQMQMQAEREAAEREQRENANLAAITGEIEGRAGELPQMFKQALLVESLRYQQQYPYMPPTQVVQNVYAQYEQAERERLASMIPSAAGSQAAPGAPPSAPPTPGAPASPDQPVRSITEATRYAQQSDIQLGGF